MKRKNPQTSIDAYKSMTIDILKGHYAEIASALTKLSKANYEQISNHLNWQDRNRTSRRLKEMEELKLVQKTGDKSLTSSGRSANNYSLIQNN